MGGEEKDERRMWEGGGKKDERRMWEGRRKMRGECGRGGEEG